MPVINPVILARALGPDTEARSGRRVGLVLIEGADATRVAEAALSVIEALAAAGCRVEDTPADGRALLRRLWRGADEAAAERETLPLPDYAHWLGALPGGYARAAAEGWKRPEDDPLFRPGTLDCGHFLIPAARFGHLAVAGWSPRPGAPSDRTPPHGHLAAIAWLRDVFRAQAILTVEGHGRVAEAPPPF